MAQMLRRSIINSHKSYFPQLVYFSSRYFCSEDKNNFSNPSKPKLRIFKDEDAPIIYDLEEGISVPNKEVQLEKVVTEKYEEVYKRGLTGVFDIEELISYLRNDNARDIFVAKVPSDLNYVEYIVVVTGNSRRHMLGLAEYIRSLHKKKKNETDIIPMIEGKHSSDWIAIDLGNIALHIMNRDAREIYDLESLWTLGPKYDTKTNQKDDEIVELMKKHSINLDDLQILKTN